SKAEEKNVRARSSNCSHQLPKIAVPKDSLEDTDTALRNIRLRRLVGPMTQCHMRNLMRDDTCKFAFVPYSHDRASVDKNEPNGQREGVDVARGNDIELIGEFVARRSLREPRAKTADVLNSRRVLK